VRRLPDIPIRRNGFPLNMLAFSFAANEGRLS
jgi:hypothetical protein